MSITVQTLRQESAKLVGAYLAHGTATAGSTTSLTDASTSGNSILQSSLSNGVERFKGAWILMTGGANIALWREIDDDNPGSGVITFAKPYGSAVSSGDTYEIYAALDPEGWMDAINAGLSRTQYLTKSPITLVSDGDMEAAGVTSWAATNATIAKSTSDVVTEGGQSLVVTNTATNGYVTQAINMACTPQLAFKLWVDYRVVSAGGETAQIQVWDVTHAKAIQAWISPDVDTGKNTQGGQIQLAWTIPAGCYRMLIQLGGAEATAVIAFDDLVVYCTQQFRYTLPSWITSREQYATLLHRWGSRPLAYEYTDVQWPLNIEEDPTALVSFRCNLPRNGLIRPVYLAGERGYGPLPASATDSTTISVGLEWAKWEVAAAAYEFFGQNLTMASMSRARADQAECEVRCNQLRAIFKAYRNARLGFSKPWIGMRPISVPGARWGTW